MRDRISRISHPTKVDNHRVQIVLDLVEIAVIRIRDLSRDFALANALDVLSGDIQRTDDRIKRVVHPLHNLAIAALEFGGITARGKLAFDRGFGQCVGFGNQTAQCVERGLKRWRNFVLRVLGCDLSAEIADGDLLHRADDDVLQIVGKLIQGVGKDADFVAAVHFQTRAKAPFAQFLEHGYAFRQRTSDAPGDHQAQPQCEQYADDAPCDLDGLVAPDFLIRITVEFLGDLHLHVNQILQRIVNRDAGVVRRAIAHTCQSRFFVSRLEIFENLGNHLLVSCPLGIEFDQSIFFCLHQIRRAIIFDLFVHFDNVTRDLGFECGAVLGIEVKLVHVRADVVHGDLGAR